MKIEDLEEKIVEISQKVAWRLRKEDMYATAVSVNLKTKDFKSFSHQKKLKGRTDSTQEIIDKAKELLKEMYKGEAIRLIGVRVEGLVGKEELQLSLFDSMDNKKHEKIDDAIDMLKDKYGYSIVSRATDLKKKK